MINPAKGLEPAPWFGHRRYLLGERQATKS
jgi:hypothetical protein